MIDDFIVGAFSQSKYLCLLLLKPRSFPAPKDTRPTVTICPIYHNVLLIRLEYYVNCLPVV
jgi:hypothetical protein